MNQSASFGSILTSGGALRTPVRFRFRLLLWLLFSLLWLVLLLLVLLLVGRLRLFCPALFTRLLFAVLPLRLGLRLPSPGRCSLSIAFEGFFLFSCFIGLLGSNLTECGTIGFITLGGGLRYLKFAAFRSRSCLVSSRHTNEMASLRGPRDRCDQCGARSLQVCRAVQS